MQWVDLNRFAGGGTIPFEMDQRGYMPALDNFPLVPEQPNFNPPGSNQFYQEAGLAPGIMQRLPQITPGGAPSVVPLPQAEQPRNQPGPGDNLIGPGNPPIRPIGPSGDYGGFQVADLNAGRDPWVNLGGNTFMPNWQQSNPEMADSFNSRFFFDQPQYNYPQPQQQLPQIPWYESNPGMSVIDDPPRSPTGGRNGNLPTIQGIQQYPQNYNQPFYGQNPTELGQFYGAPHQFDQTAPANSFNTRFNEVFNQPSYMAQEVPSFNGTSNQYVDQGFRDLGMGGPSYDQYTFNPGGDFPSFESPGAEGGMRMVGDTLPTTIAQPLPPLPGHNATGYYDPYTNATSFSQHIGPGGTPVAAGPSFVPYGGGSSFSPISSQSGVYVAANNMPILGLPTF